MELNGCGGGGDDDGGGGSGGGAGGGVCVCLRRRSTQLGGRPVHTHVSGQNIFITLVLTSFLEFQWNSLSFLMNCMFRPL